MICCLLIYVPDAVVITLGKPSELYSNEMLNILGVTKTVLLTSILMNVMVLNMCSILPN